MGCNVLRKIDPNFIVHYFVHGSKLCGLVLVNASSNRSGEFSDCTGHRRTGYFMPGGERQFAQKIFASCSNVYKTVEQKRGPMQQHRPYWHMKMARYSFSGSIPAKFEHKLRRHKQTFGKIATTVVLDKDENGCNDIRVAIAKKGRHYLLCLQQYFSVGTVLPKSITGAFFSNSRLDVREVKTEYVRALSRYLGMKKKKYLMFGCYLQKTMRF